MENSQSRLWWKAPNLLTNLVKEYGQETARQYLKYKFSQPENRMAFAFICFPHHFTLKSPPFHYEVMDLLSSPKNVGVAAPRGHAKSTMLLVDDAWDIVNANRHYIVKISDSFTQALEHTINLQEELEENEVLKWIYGDLRTDNWTQGEFVTSTDVKVVAKGQGNKIRGLKYKQWRPDKIVIDDLENDELVENAERREKLRNWFKRGVMPALAQQGKMNVIGTVLHHDALLARIVNRADEYSGWETRKYKAINEDERGRYALWPEMYSVEDLDAMRNDPTHPRYLGSITFSQEYQNEPVSEQDAVVKRAWIKYQDSPPHIKFKVITVDPAISKKETADFTAIQCWGLGTDDNCYLLEKVNARLSFRQQGYEIRAMYHRHNKADEPINEIIIEEVAYQAALKEHDQLRDLPVITLKPVKDKRTRLVVVSKWFEAGYVYFKTIHDSLVEQVVNFGSMAHDDEVDAMTMGIGRLKNDADKVQVFFA
jgi:predicted phage terminase large subunit-like protein